tara:strand:- start:784 stop:1053 length:270 start_codon:yes stop_codon:yes gene_type:complete
MIVTPHLIELKNERLRDPCSLKIRSYIYGMRKKGKNLESKERAMKHIEQMRQRGGGFDQKLVAAFEHADSSNKRKLAIGFPELFEHLVD